MTDRKRCARCGQDKSLTSFHRDITAVSGRRSTCRDCRLEETRVARTDPHVRELRRLQAVRHHARVKARNLERQANQA